jgi:hypothetical protein
MKFYQIAGDVPGTSIFINPMQVVRIVPNGSHTRIHLSDNKSYDIAQTPNLVHENILNCLR